MEVRREILKVLREATRPLTASQIAARIPLAGQDALQVYAELKGLEQKQLVKRVYDEEYDIADPLSTTKWALKEQEELEHPLSAALFVQPVITMPPALGDFKEICTSYGLRHFLDALEEILSEAENSLRIMCPFIDATLLNVMIKARAVRLGRVEVRIISERRAPSWSTLELLRSTLKNVSVKYADQYDQATRKKVLGVHAKMIIADHRSALLGSFNVTVAHVVTNLDIGILIRGPIVKALVEVFDYVWSRLGSS